jgi:hypothetical protein
MLATGKLEAPLALVADCGRLTGNPEVGVIPVDCPEVLFEEIAIDLLTSPFLDRERMAPPD